MTTIITNESLYNSLIDNVNVNNITNEGKNSFYANVQIEFLDGTQKEIDGEFGLNDYKADYGFVFISE